MANDQKKIYEKALRVAKKKGVYFIEDIIAFLPIGKTSFYEYYPIASNEMNAIVEILDGNKVKTKVEIREKLKAGSKAPELVALYKLLANDYERDALSMQRIDHTTKGKEIKPTTINYNELSSETLKDIIDNSEDSNPEEG